MSSNTRHVHILTPVLLLYATGVRQGAVKYSKCLLSAGKRDKKKRVPEAILWRKVV